MEEFYNNNLVDLAVITYHAWWPSPGNDPFYLDNITENRGRIQFYGSDYTPHYRMDGIADGGASPGSWPGLLSSRLAVDSPLTIDLVATPSGPNWNIQATITNVSAATVSGNYRVAVTESNVITPPLLNGETEHNWVMRDMVNDHLGDLITLAAGADTVINKTVVINPAWVYGVDMDNLQVVAFVQKAIPKEILQGARIFYPFDRPYLVVEGVSPTETADGDGDGLLDPGETGEIVVTLGNINGGGATGVSATLSVTDPYITVTDGTASFSDIPGFGSGSNGSNPFVVTADAGTPSGYTTTMQLDVTADGGYAVALEFELGVGSPEDHMGPDGGGYYTYEDTDVGYTETPVYSWAEIDPGLGGGGTQILELDDGTVRLTLPFTFRYYGNDFTIFTVSSNGWISMGQWFNPEVAAGPIPDPIGAPNMVAGAWADLNPAAPGSGAVSYFSDAANHRFIVEFNQIEYYDPTGSGLPETFQFILLDPAFYPTSTGEGEIILQYKDVSLPNDFVVGIENQTETIGTQYVFFGNLNPAASGIVDGRAIKFTPDAPVRTDVPGIAGPIAGGPVTLLAASPNPFREATSIRYRMPSAGQVALRVYDVEGRRVATLFEGTAPVGWHEILWDGRDESGRAMPSGLYFTRLTARGETKTGKLLLTR